MSFFDRYPLFLKSSPVGNWPDRLKARYEAIIAANRNMLRGANVLDLASHDGRWSFAALDAGAARVTGIEVRPDMVESAKANMQALSVPPESYEFVTGDMFDLRDVFTRGFDVVLCLGVFYHTARYAELIDLMNRTGASAIVIDSMLTKNREPVVKIMAERIDLPSNGKDNATTRNGEILVGHPTPAALRLMFGHYGYAIRRFNWNALLESLSIGADRDLPHSPTNPVGDYADGRRGTFVATRRA